MKHVGDIGAGNQTKLEIALGIRAGNDEKYFKTAYQGYSNIIFLPEVVNKTNTVNPAGIHYYITTHPLWCIAKLVVSWIGIDYVMPDVSGTDIDTHKIQKQVQNV